MTKLKKLNIMHIFILLLPFIDFFAAICTWNGLSIPIELFIKGIFLGYAVLYLLKDTSHRKIFAFLGIYFVVYCIHTLTMNVNFFSNIINVIKIFYLPILILFFTNYKNEKITKKTLTIVFLFYLLLCLIPYFIGVGHNMNKIIPANNLYISYFHEGNELTNVFIILLPIAFAYLVESNSYLLKGIYTILILLAFFVMGTKTLYLSIIALLLYFLITKREKIVLFIKKNYLESLLFIAVIFSSILVYLPKIDIPNFTIPLNQQENIDNIIFHGRFSRLQDVNQVYLNGNSLEKMLGFSHTKLESIPKIEMDIFTIFYTIGMIGMLFYLIFFVYVLKNMQLKNDYKYTFALLFLIAFFMGHVFMSPFVSTFLALLCLVSKNDNGRMKKDILMVSSIYPSKEYTEYGLFVKNTYEVLNGNDFVVDLVAIPKIEGNLKKFISYVKLYGISFLKALFENYDYIYVPFISHATTGVIVPIMTSKNTKLVLNISKNNMVAASEKDLRLNKFFLKHADMVVTPSKDCEKALMKEYHMPKNKIVVYAIDGVDTGKFIKLEKRTAKKKAGLDGKIKYFGYIFPIEKEMGYDTFIQAINKLNKKKELKDIKFLIIGSGKEEETLNELIQKYRLQKRIERKPFAEQDDLVNIYNSVEAFIFPSKKKSESLELTCLEVMACQTLVIASDKFSHYLEENKNGLLFHADDYKELSIKIEEVLNMKKKDKNRLIKEARITSEEFSLQNTKDSIIKVFQK